MAEVFGSGEYKYRIVDNWAKLPDGWEFGDVAAVGVDKKDQVYVFHRGPHPLIVFDRNGNYLRSWGDGVYVRPHGVHIAPDESIYLTDDGDHSVRKCTLEGKVLMTLGVPGKHAPFMSGDPFNRCTHTALSPRGDIYVSDGYGNGKVHKYSPDGKLLKSWGEPGAGKGEFNLPHNISCDEDGWVYVADRENHRIQVFDGDGRFETQWHDLHRPCSIFMPAGKCPICYVGETGPYYGFNRGAPNLGPRLSILSNKGELLARIETTPSAGTGPGQFLAPHGLTVDSRGDLYVAEVGYTAWPSLFPGVDPPKGLRCLQKFEKLAS